MILVSNPLLLLSKEAISGKTYTNKPLLDTRTTDLKRDLTNSIILYLLAVKGAFLKDLKKKTSLRNPKEVSNVRAFQIFERKVLLSMQTVDKFSNATFFRQIASQNLQRKNLGLSETETCCHSIGIQK